MILSRSIEFIYYSLLTLLAVKSVISLWQTGFSARRFLDVYIILTAILELCGYYFIIRNIMGQTGLVYNFYCLFSMIMFYLLYRKGSAVANHKVLDAALVSALFFYFFRTEFYGTDFDTSIGIVISLYYISIALSWFYYKIKTFSPYKITDDPFFWVSTALLLWSCFFIFRVVPMFFFSIYDREFLGQLHVAQNAVNIVMYLLIFISLKKGKRWNE